MAIRKIREIGDEVLTKTCKEVPKMTLRNKILSVKADRCDRRGGRTDRSCKPQDRGNFRRTDRRRRLLKCAGKSRTGDKTGLCQSGCTE